MNISSNLKKNKTKGIYCIMNTVNNNIYIGSSINIYNRLMQHKSKLNKGNHTNRYLQNSIIKYGLNNYISYILEEVKDSTNLATKEQYWIDILLPEYNITKEVVRNTPSEESKKLISSTLKRGYASGEITSKSETAIDVFNLDGKYIKSYDSQRKAAIDLGIHYDSIWRCLKQKYKQSNGYQFRYSYENVVGLPKTKIKERLRISKKIIYTKKSNPIDVFDTQDNYIKSFILHTDCAKELGVSIMTITKQLANSEIKGRKYSFRYSKFTTEQLLAPL